MKKLIPLMCLLLLASCAREMGASTYNSAASVGKVARGQIIYSEPIVIRDAERMQDNALGGLAGGALGGISASAAGKGTGRDLATAGGVIAGAVIGAAIQDQLSVQDGTMYVIELSSPAPKDMEKFRINRRNIERAGASVTDDVKEAIRLTPQQSELISVIQTNSQIAAGTPVLVIYHEDRPRVVVDQSRINSTGLYNR